MDRYDRHGYERDATPLQIVLLAVAIFVAIFLAVILMGPAIDHEYDEMDRRAREACQEDEPCWDCETMGNRICGVRL